MSFDLGLYAGASNDNVALGFASIPGRSILRPGQSPEFELDEPPISTSSAASIGTLRGKWAGSSWREMSLPPTPAMSLAFPESTTARPVQAALTSALSFSVGAAMPLLMVVVSPAAALVPIVAAASLGFLALLGAIGGWAGGANVLRATARVTFWGTGIGVNTKVVFRIMTTMPTSRLVASNGVGQRGWITFSKYRSTGTARCTRAARCRVGKGRAAMPRGKTGAGWPAIIWNAGIIEQQAGND